MLRQMKLSTKLIGSFIIVALITLLVGFFGWRGINVISGHLVKIGTVNLPGIQNLLLIDREAEAVRVAQRTLLNPNLDVEARANQFAHLKAAKKRYEAAWKRYEQLPQTPEERGLWEAFIGAWEAWHKENDRFFGKVDALDKLDLGNPEILDATIERIRGDHYKLMVNTLELIFQGKNFQGGEDHISCDFGKWLTSFETKNKNIKEIFQKLNDPHSRFHQAVADIKAAVAQRRQEEAQQLFHDEMAPAADEIFKGLQELNEITEEAVGLFAQAGEFAMGVAREKQVVAINRLHEIVKLNDDAAQAANMDASNASRRAGIVAVVGMVAGFLVALAFGIFFGTTISRVLNRIIGGLSEGADQVASASGQVSGTSQTLAEGASEQAASIEETSSSMEEMSAMIRKSAENAGQANALMQDTNTVVEQANRSMDALTHSMEDIAKASDETSRIIKTIDEISFQTNLLALNAAVEAARAGEAGAGFAVVADEVRNLAMRAADAAKSTATLIEGTVKKINDGSRLVSSTNEAFDKVADSSAKVGELISEISAASHEQSGGIDQVNTAITEMDRVVQQNAANAEESASASEEMSAQAEELKGYVERLVRLVEGKRSPKRAMGSPRVVTRKRSSPQIAQRSVQSSTALTKVPAGAGKTGEIRPEQVIPFDEDEVGGFEDF